MPGWLRGGCGDRYPQPWATAVAELKSTAWNELFLPKTTRRIVDFSQFPKVTSHSLFFFLNSWGKQVG